MLQIIQFPHPIWEDLKTKNGSIKPWNNSDHKRNFIISPGEAIVAKGTAPKSFNSISFWGEWEPEARIVNRFNNANPPITPKRLIAPLYPNKMPNLIGTKCCANTDPFVFGEHFKYSNCRQNTAGKPNRMQDLSADSLILFGGVTHGEFWLDTVFVVKDYVKFDGRNYKSSKYSLNSFLKNDYPLFEDATLKPLAALSNPLTYTLYRGQTYWENKKYFSFVPCDAKGNVFAKVKLTKKVVAGLSACAQNFTVLGEPPIDGTNPQAVWDAIVDCVFSQGLSLGVRFKNVRPLPQANSKLPSVNGGHK